MNQFSAEDRNIAKVQGGIGGTAGRISVGGLGTVGQSPVTAQYGKPPNPPGPGISDTAQTLVSEAQAIRNRLSEIADRLTGPQPATDVDKVLAETGLIGTLRWLAVIQHQIYAELERIERGL